MQSIEEGTLMRPRVSVLVSSIGQGGAEKIMSRLAVLMAENGNIQVDLVIVTPIKDETRQSFSSSQVNLIELDAKHYMSVLKPAYEAFQAKKGLKLLWLIPLALINLVRSALLPIIRYIKKAHPDIIFTVHYNSVVILANWFAGAPSKIVITEHTVLSKHFPSQIWFIKRFFPSICRFFYPRATKVIGVSRFVAEDLIEYLTLPPRKVIYIYNPVVGDSLIANAAAECYHPWFGGDIPVFVAVGRLSAEKDFKTLLEAFAILRNSMDARLLILGGGLLLSELREYAQKLEVNQDVGWLGFVNNPLPYIKEAQLFLMSSLYEGFGLVVIESLLVGTTVVVADSPGGIREILNNGEYGYIVPVRSPKGMADVILSALKKPFDSNKLRARAMFFSEKNSVKQYYSIISELLGFDCRGERKN
jgi:glycosyltransferase involved in cell wall biosynthesis